MRSAVRPSHSGGGAGLAAGAGRTGNAPMSDTAISRLVPCVTVIGRSVDGRAVKQGMPR